MQNMNFDNNVFLTDIEIAHTVLALINAVYYERENLLGANMPYLINIARKLLDSTQFMVESQKESYIEQLNDLENDLNAGSI